jgi:hypothetical protein
MGASIELRSYASQAPAVHSIQTIMRGNLGLMIREHRPSSSVDGQRPESPPLFIDTSDQTLRELFIFRQQITKQIVAFNTVISNDPGDEIVCSAEGFLVYQHLPNSGFRVMRAGVETPLTAHTVNDIATYFFTRQPDLDPLPYHFISSHEVVDGTEVLMT